MPMIPPLVRDPPPDGRQSSTARPVAARLARSQRQYASKFNISFVYEPPRLFAKPGLRAPEGPFDKWRAAAAELDPAGGGAGGPPRPAALGDAPASSVAAVPRRRLHDVLLGSTAVVLLGVLGVIVILVCSGAVPGAAASGGPAPKDAGVAALFQPLVDLAAKVAARMAPDHALSFPPGEEATAGVPAPQPVAALPPSTVPASVALAAPLADKPALTGPPPLASEHSAVAGEAVPVPE